jgi:hypothetical protein
MVSGTKGCSYETYRVFLSLDMPPEVDPSCEGTTGALEANGTIYVSTRYIPVNFNVRNVRLVIMSCQAFAEPRNEAVEKFCGGLLAILDGEHS